MTAQVVLGQDWHSTSRTLGRVRATRAEFAEIPLISATRSLDAGGGVLDDPDHGPAVPDRLRPLSTEGKYLSRGRADMQTAKFLSAGVAAALFGSFAMTAGASAAAGAARGKGPPAPPAAPAPQHCYGQHASGHSPSRDEWASCISVTASLSQAPAVGQMADLRVTVKALEPHPSGELQIDLPSVLGFVSTAGMSRSAILAGEGAGQATRASRHDVLQPGKPRTYTVQIKGLKPGVGQIRARFLAPAGGRAVDAGADLLFLTVGSARAASHMGFTLARTDFGVRHAAVSKTRAAAPIRA